MKDFELAERTLVNTLSRTNKLRYYLSKKRRLTYIERCDIDIEFLEIMQDIGKVLIIMYDSKISEKKTEA